MSQRLIMVAGLPRSGTTWLGKIFDSHPDTLYRHEPDSVYAINGLPHLAEVNNTEQYLLAIDEFAAALPEMNLTKVVATLPIFAKNYYACPELFVRKVTTLVAKLGGRFLGELPVRDMTNYRGIADLPVVWKSIESVGRIGVLCRAVKHCHAILLLRHPCGYIASVLRGEAKKKFTSSTPTHENHRIYDMLLGTEQARRYGLTQATLRCMQPVERLAWRWVLYNEKAMDDVAGMRGCRYVRYEDICTAPVAHSRALFEFAGLGWSEQTEAFLRRSTASENSSYYSVFKDPLKSAYKWKNEMAAGDVARVLALVKDTKPGRLYLERS